MIKIGAKGSRKDLIGKKFGKLTALYFNEQLYEEARKKGKYIYKWVCECNCKENDKTIVNVSQSDLIRGVTKSCGCIKVGSDIEDLTGKQFGRLTVLNFDQEAYDEGIKNGNYEYRWICECNCDNHTIKSIDGSCLKNGNTVSCGCYIREKLIESSKKYNKYNLKGSFGIGWTTNTNKTFYFDLEDYNKIKDYAWHESGNGYITTIINKKHIKMHRLIMGLGKYDNKITVDHVYHYKQDNRKKYLRIIKKQENECNKKNALGVHYDKSRDKWVGRLSYKKKNYSKRFNTYEEALEYRKYLEDKYFGEYAYQTPPPEYIEELKLN